MSLETLLQTLQVMGDSQINEIEQDAGKRIHTILTDAQNQAIRERDKACEFVLHPAFRERARILHAAHLDAIKIVGIAREELITAILRKVQDCLFSSRTDPSYPDILRKLVYEAFRELNVTPTQAGNYRLQGNPLDKDLMVSILFDLGLNLVCDYSLNCWGGVIVMSMDQRVTVINTLEARFERAVPYIRRYLANQFDNYEKLGEISPVISVDPV